MDDTMNLAELEKRIRNLKPNSDDADFKEIFEKTKEKYEEQKLSKEMARYNLLVFDVRDRGYTGDAAMVKRGLLDIEDISDEGLANLEERLRAENKDMDFFGAGSFDDLDDGPSVDHAVKGAPGGGRCRIEKPAIVRRYVGADQSREEDHWNSGHGSRCQGDPGRIGAGPED